MVIKVPDNLFAPKKYSHLKLVYSQHSIVSAM